MDIFAFIVTVVVVTASGALAPGPLFFTNIAHGTKSGAKGGLAFSVGHTIVEFSLVMLLALFLNAGLSTFADKQIKLVIGAIGGIALLIFGVLQIHNSLTASKSNSSSREWIPSRNPIFLGSFFTGLNPYFIVWWLTYGLWLITVSLAFASFTGVVLMYVAHVWMDYAWLIATAYLAKKGTSLIGSKGYRIVMTVLGIVLVYFGLQNLVYSFSV